MNEINQELSEYGEGLSRLDLAVRAAIWASVQGGSKQGGERRYWSSVLFTRISTVARSLLVLCPKPVKAGVEGNWDFASIASLTRNLFEGAAFFHYFTEPVEGDEWRARLNIMQLNDATHRSRMFEQFGNEVEVDSLKKAVEDLRQRLSTNSYFLALDLKLQKQLLQGYRPSIFTLRENMSRLTADDRIWGFFEFFSSHTHTLPLSFYRIREQNRTGVESDMERSYIGMAMQLARDVLNEVTEKFKADFADLVSFQDLPDGMHIQDLMSATTPVPTPPANRAQRRATQRELRRRR